MTTADLRRSIFSINTEADFLKCSLELFRLQHQHNTVYRSWCDALGIAPDEVNSLSGIPFIPVSFFRDHTVVTGDATPQAMFLSSGTTGSVRSIHHIIDLSLYEESFIRAFSMFYGDPSSNIILALLPSYLEREGSSLVYMAEKLIARSPDGEGGFYLNNYEKLIRDIDHYRRGPKRLIVLGVTFALLELAERYAPDLQGITVMETGGMKGMRRELVRAELHDKLNNAFGTTEIHSEYGMTELLSQAYSKGKGVFRSPPWMKILVADINDPLSISHDAGSSGSVNIIDLANIWSCAFIATSDLGRIHSDGSFEITGRYDNSDVRGCNLLAV